jgi:hypothetical protein
LIETFWDFFVGTIFYNKINCAWVVIEIVEKEDFWFQSYGAFTVETGMCLKRVH